VTFGLNLKGPAEFNAQSAAVFRSLAFKKTCPFEFTRHGRPKAGTETRPCLLPSEVSQGESQKGKSRFSGERLKSKLIGLSTGSRAVEKAEPKPIGL
jgi:hypothetical protein